MTLIMMSFGISNHLALSAPAFGNTAMHLAQMFGKDSELVLTKMADSDSELMTNNDVLQYINKYVIPNPEVKLVICSIAFCDYEYPDGGFYRPRKLTENGDIDLHFTVAPKIIDHIRKERPDIFLVGFKTTTNETVSGQFLRGLKMMKRSKCNLVLANDTITRNNIIITPEETYYANTTNRLDALYELHAIIVKRLANTFDRTTFIKSESFSTKCLSPNFVEVLKFVIDHDGFIENNGNGFTPGHFCERLSGNTFISSQRKADHNKVFEEGMSVSVEKGKFTVHGERKASVGARSQWMFMENNPGYDFIIHTHSPIRPGSVVATAQQKWFQCGSTECGLNGLNNLKDYGNGIKAVYLEKHGPNILFDRKVSPEVVCKFIDDNFILGEKTI